MKIRTLVTAVSILFAVSCTTIDQRNFQITEFRQGKMRLESGLWDIYKSGDTFQYLENGRCRYGQTTIACMWYGIVLEYETNMDKVLLDCVSRAEAPVTYVDIEGVKANSETQNTYQLELDGSSARHAVPGYISSGSDSDPYRSHITCSFGGSQVLDYTWDLLFDDQDTK